MKTKRLFWMLTLALLAALLISGTAFAEGEEPADTAPAENSQAPPADPVENESSSEETTAAEPPEESAPVEPAPEPEPIETGADEEEVPILAPDVDEPVDEPGETEEQQIPAEETEEACPDPSGEAGVEAVDVEALSAGEAASGGDPRWQVGKQWYSVIYTGGTCYPGTSIAANTCFEFDTDLIGNALITMKDENAWPTNGLLYVDGHASAYQGFTINPAIDPNHSLLKGVVGVDGSGQTTITGNIVINGTSSGFTLSGFTINGGVTFTANTGNLALTDLAVKNTAGDGIRVTSHTGNITLTNVKSSGNSGGTTAYGAILNNTDGGNVTVTNSAFDHNTHANTGRGLWIDSGGIVTINGLSANGNSHQGVRVWGFSRLTISNMVVKHNGSYGAYFHTTQAAAVTLQNVYASRNAGSYGIGINTTGSVRVTDGHFSNNSGHGLWVWSGAKSVSITRANFDDNTQAGAFIEASGAVTLADASASRNGSAGTYSGIKINNAYAAGAPVTVRSSAKNIYRAFMDNTNYGIEILSKGAVSISGVRAEGNTAAGISADNRTDTRPGVTLSGIIAGNGNSTGVYILSQGNINVRDIEASGNNQYGMFLDNSSGSGNVRVAPSSKTGVNIFNENGFYGLFIFSKGTITLSGILAEGNINEDNLYIDNSGADAARAVSVSSSNLHGSQSGYGLRIQTKGTVTLTNVSAGGNHLDGANINAAFGTISASVTVRGAKQSADFSGNNGYGLRINTRGAVTLQNVVADNNNGYGIFINNRYAGSAAPVRVSASKGMWNSASGNQGSYGLRVESYGAISIANLLCEDNQQYGAGLVNTRESPDLPVRAVTITASVFSGTKTYDGLNVESEGAVAIRDSHADGNKRGGMGILTKGTVTLSGVTASGNQGTDANYPGVYIGNTSGDGNVVINSSKAVQTEFSWNLYHGARIHTNGSVSITNTCAENNSERGVFVAQSAASISVRAAGKTAASRFSGNGDTGLYLVASGPISLSGNILIEGNTNYGGLVSNVITGVANPQPITVSGVTASGNGWNGLRVVSYGDITVSSITAENNGATGTTSEERAGLYLFNRGTGWDGIGNLTVTGRNVLNGNLGDGLRAITNGVISVSGVSAQGNADCGLYVWGYGAGNSVTLRDITAINNTTDGISLIANGDQTLRGITSLMNGRHGIWSNVNSHYALLHTCRVMGNDGHGIYLQSVGTNYDLLNSVYIGNDAVDSGYKDLYTT